jgi:hypothetical protein
MLGLKIPVIVFGYHSLKRSTSWRSNTRVPTHLILYYRNGQSIENVSQGAGRATFNGSDILFNNMKRDYIGTLITRSDFNLVQRHNKVIREIIQITDVKSNGSDVNSAGEMILQKVEEFRSTTKRKSGVFDFDKLSGPKKRRMLERLRISIPPLSQRRMTEPVGNKEDLDRSNLVLVDAGSQQRLQYQEQPPSDEQEDDLLEATDYSTDNDNDTSPLNQGSEITLPVMHDSLRVVEVLS